MSSLGEGAGAGARMSKTAKPGSCAGRQASPSTSTSFTAVGSSSPLAGSTTRLMGTLVTKPQNLRAP